MNPTKSKQSENPVKPTPQAFAVLVSAEERLELLTALNAGVQHLGATGLNLIVVGQLFEKITKAQAVTLMQKAPTQNDKKETAVK